MHQEESRHAGNGPDDATYAAMLLDDVAMTVALDELCRRCAGQPHERILLDHGFESPTMLPVWVNQNLRNVVPSGDPVQAFEFGVLLGLVLADQHTGLAHDGLA